MLQKAQALGACADRRPVSRSYAAITTLFAGSLGYSGVIRLKGRNGVSEPESLYLNLVSEICPVKQTLADYKYPHEAEPFPTWRRGSCESDILS